MTLSKLRFRSLGIACAVAVATLLSGCGASAGGASTAAIGSGGSSAPAAITGIATPKSVSVVTAN